MTHPRPRITLAALLLLAAPASAADFPVKITSARVGLPPGGAVTERDENGQAIHVAKFAAWAPVYVELEVGASVNDAAELLVEAADPDEITTTLAVPLNLAGQSGKVSAADLGTIGYVRPAGMGEVTLTVRTKDGKALSEPFRIRSVRPREPLTYVALSLGAPFPGFDLPKPAGAQNDQSGLLRGGRVELTTISDVNALPDRWIGYEAADVVVLNTAPGSDEFLRRLFGDSASASDKAKRAALLEWVRRGGRLVVTVGGNAGLVAQLPALRDLLPFEVKGPRTATAVPLNWSARESSTTSTLSGTLGNRATQFPMAQLSARPDRAARILIPPPDRLAANREVVAAQAGFGLGKVTVVGFDLDRAPFTDFSQRPEFWDWVLREGGTGRAAGDGKPRGPSSSLTEDEDELAVALRTHADTFDGVPVVSFGWVALLIVLYILLIGPVEYYFLKRVLGRLELTWITFPVIVLTVSLAAYFSAYALKGRDLKINKVDVIDIDAAGGRVYGTTWFTVFSPRIDTYTIGVTPAEGWGEAEPGTAVSWVGAPRGGRASLLRRKYAYHTDADAVADGLEKVPVQVWATKSFVANFSGRFDPASASATARSELVHPPGDPNAVIGTFTLNLPVPVLSDCVILYAGQVYPLAGGTIRSGETIRPVWDKASPAPQWLQKEAGVNDILARVRSDRGNRGPGAAAGQRAAGSGFPLWGVLFHDASIPLSETMTPSNASLRRLDQSWRLAADNRNEAILVGRAAPPIGPAEETLSGPNAASRLWLRGLPGSGERAAVPGTGRQETWVRVYLPVR